MTYAISKSQLGSLDKLGMTPAKYMVKRVFSSEIIFLLLITLIGAIFRFTNLNWDNGGRLHPDEALIVNGAMTVRFFGNLFPGFHDYNGFSVYLLRITTLLYSGYMRQISNLNSTLYFTLVGRFLSATFSTLSIPLIYLIGVKIWRKEIGLLAAIFFAFIPLSIQLAHFYTTESILIFLLTLLIAILYSFWNSPSFFKVIFISVVSGLMLATKNTSYLFLPVPITLIFLRTKNIKYVLVFLLTTLTSFFMGSPYSLLDLPGYLTRSAYLSNVVTAKLIFGWTMEFQNTGLFFWMSNLLWGMGFMGLVGLTGAIYILFLKSDKNKNFLQILSLFTFALSFFFAFTYLKFIRYDAPLLPLLTLFSAKIIWDLRKFLLGKIFFSILILSQIIWGVMFFHVYLSPHTSLAAGVWISKNIPPRSIILTEYWNSIIRFERPELAAKNYQFEIFDFYIPESTAKTAELHRYLSSVSYIILESPKVENTVLRLKNIYPQTGIFYQDLNYGKLGFKLVAEFKNYPGLGPFTINDESAEETFTVFDHPTMRIYKKI